jgi:hypothetical protein
MASCTDRDNMGFDLTLFGNGSSLLDICFPKMKNRWLFQIDGVCGVANTLPPIKSARPQLDFKEQQISHLVQDIYYPIKADWKPIQLTLYDIDNTGNAVFEWIKMVYDPKPDSDTEWSPVYSNGGNNFKKDGVLCLYNGCGAVVEQWKYENCYPQAVNFGDLEMSEMKIVVMDVTLRYDRAYIVSNG